MEGGAILNFVSFIVTIKKFSKIFDPVIKIACTILMGIIVFIVVLSVFARYFLSYPIYWIEEASMYLLIWLVFLAAGVALRRGQHIGLEYFIKKFPENFFVYFRFINLALVIIFLLVLIYSGWRVATFAGKFQKSPTIGISMFWVYLAIPSGAFIMGIQALLSLLLNHKR